MEAIPWMLRRRSKLLWMAGVAMASASAVLLWRAALLERAIAIDNTALAEAAAKRDGAGEARASGSLQAAGAPTAAVVQGMLRRVDRAAAQSGVRLATVNVHSPDRPEGPARLEVELSGHGAYREVKNLVERLLQSDASLALDRISLTRAAESPRELDAQLKLHQPSLEAR